LKSNFREENDIDEELSKPLYKRVPEMEREMVLNKIRVEKHFGRETESLEQRLEELDNRIALQHIK